MGRLEGKDRRGTDLERVRENFDHWADSYDAEVAKGTGVLEGYLGSRQRASRLVAVSPGMRVADVGIGTGAFAELFAAQGAAVTGIDLSPRMLAICAQRHPEYRLLEGNFTAIPLASGTQDLVVSSFAFHELTDADRALAIAECMRVATPAGSFLLVDIMFEDAARLRAARGQLGELWDDENYALFSELSGLAKALDLEVQLEILSQLHGAALFSRRSAHP